MYIEKHDKYMILLFESELKSYVLNIDKIKNYELLSS